MIRSLLIFMAVVACLVASDPGIGDWPMWGGTPDRNMVSSQHVVTSWDVKTGKNVKWVAQLCSQSYGNPVVAGGQVYVGTNNELVRDPKEPGDRLKRPAHARVPVRDRPVAVERQPLVRHRSPP